MVIDLPHLWKYIYSFFTFHISDMSRQGNASEM
jgi:hypothetical protein